MNFRPNCTCRADVLVLVIRPKVDCSVGVAAVPPNTVRLGVLKLARFRALNISARTCIRLVRGRLNVFVRLRSSVATPGIVIVPRDRLPRVKRGGTAKADGSMY